MSAAGLTACVDKMRAGGVPRVAIDTFAHYYDQLAGGETGLIPESDIESVGTLPALDDLGSAGSPPREIWDQAVVIKLNGGLGTSMGMSRAKSLLPVKAGLAFLDIIARQILHLSATHGCGLPLVLMDSFHTRDDTLAYLHRYPDLADDVPLDFLQHRVPKVRADDLSPISWPADPELEWAPPGHGDLYTALVTSGMLATLLDRGYLYAFVSNADNLGAVVDPVLLAWFASEDIPFLVEVAHRTDADRKGGHLARRRSDGRLILRESAQTPEGDKAAFQDIDKYKYFNTNSLWLHLGQLRGLLDASGSVLGLPLIRNKKTVDPTDPSSPAVYQLETAMGAAISIFTDARAVRVPRTRFVPVKTTNDLLGVRSDAYVLTEDDHVIVSPARTAGNLFVDLDPAHYKLLADMESRFPFGPPSLIDCGEFVVRGDVTFGADVVARGEVRVDDAGPGRRRVPDGTVLQGKY